MRRIPSKTITWIGTSILAAAGILVWGAFQRKKPEDRVYRIGWDPDPPFQAADPEGRGTGLAIELVREAARRRGIRLEWVRQRGGADAALRDQKVDLWPLLTLVPERRQYVHITEPYLETEHCFLVRAESGFTETRDLAGALISFHDLRINRINLKMALPGARLLATSATDKAIESVCRRGADAAFVDEYTAISAMLGGLTCAGHELLLIATPEIQARMGIGSTFVASPAADAIRDEIGKIAGEGKLPPPLLQWSYFSRRHMESLQALREANKRQRLLTVLAGILFSALLIVGWLTHRTLRERRRAKSAEKELDATLRSYRLLTEQAADGVFLVDGKARFVLVNIRLCEMVGYSKEEMLQLTVLDTCLPDEREAVRLRLEGTACGATMRFEGHMRRNDGTAVPIEASVVRLWDGSAQGIIRDITERKQAEAALRESEERFRKMADTAPVMIWLTGPDQLFTFVNRTWLNFTGRTTEQELGTGWAASVHPDDRQRCYQTFSSAFDARQDFQLECRLRRADGEYRSILCSGVPRFAPGGNFAGYIGSDIDINDLQSEERFRQMAENIDQVFWLLDLAAEKMLYVSPAFDKLWGRSSAAVYQNTDWLLESVHAEDRNRFTAFFTRVKSEPAEEYYRIVRPDGFVRWIHDRAFLVHDPAGKPYRVAGIAEDITAHRELEEQLRQAQKMEAIGRLAGGIAHDFNNLLTIICGYSEMLLDGTGATDPRREKLEQVLSAANRAGILTRQLLAFSRREAPQPTLVNVNRLLSNMEAMLRRLIGEHITIETALEPDLSCIQADPNQIEQVVLNLAANARDAMPNAGRLRIETSMVDAPDKESVESPYNTGRCVRLRISDTGGGMDDRTRERAFEPFFTTKDVGKGTGLGLSMVYGIVRQNQGTIHLSSEPGQGTVVDLCFPAMQASELESTAPAGQVGTTGVAATILIAEDEPGVRERVRQTLEQFGHTVLEATDGYEALRLIEERKSEIHLLLTDVIMPLMNGRELARRLKLIRPEVKVLYMSGYTDDVLAFHGIDQAEIDLIQKPFTQSEIARKVQIVLSAHRAAGR
jgi:PAS domain S-box-containing protein